MSKKNKNKSKQPPAETGHDFRAEKLELLIRNML